MPSKELVDRRNCKLQWRQFNGRRDNHDAAASRCRRNSRQKRWTARAFLSPYEPQLEHCGILNQFTPRSFRTIRYCIEMCTDELVWPSSTYTGGAHWQWDIAYCRDLDDRWSMIGDYKQYASDLRPILQRPSRGDLVRDCTLQTRL